MSGHSENCHPAEAGQGHVDPATPNPSPRMEQKLVQLVDAAGNRADLRRRLAAAPPPDTEELIQLYRVLVFNLLSQTNPGPEALKQVDTLMKPVLAWSRLLEQRRLCDLAEQKYRDQVAAQKALEEAKKLPPPEGGLSEECLALIERQLNLF